MRKLIPLLLFVFAAISVNAQLDIEYGVKGGLSSSSISMDNVKLGDTMTIENVGEAMVGIHFGGFLRVEVLGFFVQPELLFSSNGGKVAVKDLRTTNPAEIKNQRFNKIDIPIIVGKKLGPVRLGVGPVAGIMISSKSDLLDVDSYEEKFKSAVWGFQAGVGLNVSKLGVDLRYEGSLSKYGESITVRGIEFPTDTRTSQLLLSVSYSF